MYSFMVTVLKHCLRLQGHVQRVVYLPKPDTTVSIEPIVVSSFETILDSLKCQF